MKKQLLLKQKGILLAFLGFLCVISVNATTWTPPAPVGSAITDGAQVYVYSVGAKAFLDRGGEWDTQAIVTPSTGSVITTVASSSLWILQYETSAKCLKHDVGSGWTFTDGNVNNTWTVVETDAVNHVYSLQVPSTFTPDYNVDQFLGTSATVYSSNNEGTVYDVRYNRTVSGDYTKWMFVAAADVALYNAKVQLDKYMTIAQLVGSSVDLTTYVSTYNAGVTADINTAVTNLKAALTVTDKTTSITNPSFASTATTGWPGAANYGWNGTDKVLEYYRQNNKTLSQTVTGLPAGVYVVKAQGFQRCFGTATADRTAYTNGSDYQPAKLFVTASGTTSFIPLRSLFSETASPSGTTVDTYLFPNSQTTAAAAFAAGLYENELGYVTVDGTGSITFGMTVYYQGSKDGEWNVVDNFRLYYYGALAIPIISASKSSFTFSGNDNYLSDSLTVSGSNLSGTISVTAPAGITVIPTTLASNASNVKVFVTYDNATSVSGNITFTSGATTANVAVTGGPNTGCFTPLFSTGNLITDPYCSSYLTDGWGTKSINTDPAYVYCGTSSVYINGGSNDRALNGTHGNAQMLANTTYRVKAKVYGVSGTNGVGVYGWSNGQADIYHAATNGSWQDVDFTFTSGATLGGSQGIYFNAGTGYIDNWEMYVVSPTTAVKTANELSKPSVYMKGNAIVTDFELAQSSNVEISVFNAQGMLLNKTIGSFNAGKNSKVVDVNLTSGLYLVKLTQNGKSITAKVIR